jgi:hypothetical protein
MPSCSYCCFGTILLVLLLAGPGTNQALVFAFTFTFAPSSTNSKNSARVRTTTTTVLEATNCNNNNNNDRRNFLVSVLSTTTISAAAAATLVTTTARPEPAIAASGDDHTPKTKKRYVLDEETGDYVEVIEEDGNWQKEWKSRYDQMSTMSKDEIFVAARGAGNVDSKDLANESLASKKRRAFSGCRDKATRAKLDNIAEKLCAKLVLEGDIEFVLNVL